jgi:hypothetical protein
VTERKVRYYVVFNSSFRYDAAPCISHETESETAERTYCGRIVADAATFEPDSNDLDPDCITCRRISRARREAMPLPRKRPDENAEERAGRERAEEDRFDYLKDEGLLRRP